MNTKFFSVIFFFSLTTCSILCEQAKSTYDLLGYESNVSHIYHANETTKTPVIGVLGMGDPAHMYKGKFDTEKTFTVTFSFGNTVLANYPLNPITIFKALQSINVGQECDATALLHTIIECYKKGHKKIHIFANSRGGGATIMALEILANPEKYPHIWGKLGIVDPETQTALRTMVAQGTIFLAHPLLDHTKAILQSTSNKVPNFSFFKKGFYWLARTALYCVTKFDYTYPTHISMIIQNLNSEKWPYSITIALAQPDEITGNAHDQHLACLARIYPEKLTIIAGGRGHTDIRASVQLCREQLFYNNSFSI